MKVTKPRVSLTSAWTSSPGNYRLQGLHRRLHHGLHSPSRTNLGNRPTNDALGQRRLDIPCVPMHHSAASSTALHCTCLSNTTLARHDDMLLPLGVRCCVVHSLAGTMSTDAFSFQGQIRPHNDTDHLRIVSGNKMVRDMLTWKLRHQSTSFTEFQISALRSRASPPAGSSALRPRPTTSSL